MEEDQLIDSKVLVTGQHREMLDQVLSYFNIIPDYDLNIMLNNQGLNDMASNIIEKINPILKKEKPDIVLVHGDTTTTMASSIAAFYQKIKIGHVEAGLRSENKYSPFPEEINRQVTDVVSDIYFAPTNSNKKNLLLENKREKDIFITGNTIVDTMNYTIIDSYYHKDLPLTGEKIILVTMHRRENLGEPMRNVFKDIAKIAKRYSDVRFIFPMHRNPKVREEAHLFLDNFKNISLIEPLSVLDFHNFAKRSYLILTDSGGIQEEAPSLNVPVLVLRNTTERQEGLNVGTLKLIGTKKGAVFQEVVNLLENTDAYENMRHFSNPYGDGKASHRIIEAIKYYFGFNETYPEEFCGSGE